MRRDDRGRQLIFLLVVRMLLEIKVRGILVIEGAHQVASSCNCIPITTFWEATQEENLWFLDAES